MPHKGPPSVCLLHHEFGVVVVHLPSQQLPHGPGHLLTAPHHSSDVLARLVPQTHPAVAAMTVRHHEGVLDDAVVLLNVLVEVRQLLTSEE